MSGNMRTKAKNMVKRLVEQAKPPRDHVNQAFLKLRDLHNLPSIAYRRFGITIINLAKEIYPNDEPSRRAFVKEVSRGDNMRLLRYAMEEIGLLVVATNKKIDEAYPGWQTSDFTPTVMTNYDFICGGRRERVGYGFIFVSRDRMGAALLRAYHAQLSGRSIDNAQKTIDLTRSKLRLIRSDQIEPIEED